MFIASHIPRVLFFFSRKRLAFNTKDNWSSSKCQFYQASLQLHIHKWGETESWVFAFTWSSLFITCCAAACLVSNNKLQSRSISAKSTGFPFLCLLPISWIYRDSFCFTLFSKAPWKSKNQPITSLVLPDALPKLLLLLLNKDFFSRLSCGPYPAEIPDPARSLNGTYREGVVSRFCLSFARSWLDGFSLGLVAGPFNEVVSFLISLCPFEPRGVLLSSILLLSISIWSFWRRLSRSPPLAVALDMLKVGLAIHNLLIEQVHPNT